MECSGVPWGGMGVQVDVAEAAAKAVSRKRDVRV